MAGASAILGPLLDNQHSLHGVLAYTHPIEIALPGLLVETTWWTPLLFAVAGAIIGVGTPLLDELLSSSNSPETKENEIDPSWAVVLIGITAFVLQYWASAELDAPLLGQTLGGTSVPTIDAALGVAAVATWAALDGTPQGLFMAGLTAVAGPTMEMVLISQGLYNYSHPQFLELVPTWIAWTYFAGGPAVGNLGRKVAAEFKKRRQ
jgi:hypothetical protein